MEDSTFHDHAARPDVTPQSSTKVTLAFDRDTFPVLVTKLQTEGPESVEIIQAALRACVRLLPTALNTAKATSAGAIPEFARLCRHDDLVIRQRASNALVIALNAGQAKTEFVTTGQLEPFKPVVSDPDVQVRSNALTALTTLSFSAPFPDAIQAAGYVPLLVLQAKDEENAEVKALVLGALAKICNAGGPGQREAVENDKAVGICVSLLMAAMPAVRREAARLLTLLTFTDEGKALAVSGNAVAELVGLMGRESDPAVLSEVASACMVIAVDNKAKLAFIEAGLEPLVKLLESPSALVRQPTLRCIASVAAHPEGRPTLLRLEATTMIEALLEKVSGREKELVETTLSVVKWVP